MYRIAFLCLFLNLGGLSAQEKAKTEDLNRLFTAMSGSFSSEEQAKKNPQFLHITLQMTPIWKDRKDEYWLYVEQAVAAVQDKPYRQRVYQLKLGDDGRLQSIVYTLPGDALPYAGEWKKPNPLAKLTPKELVLREGCSIYLTLQKDNTFKGSTDGKDCASDLKGAKYATSEVTITSDTLTSWDRGFDANGKQVWGSVDGAYIFKKIPVPKK